MDLIEPASVERIANDAKAAGLVFENEHRVAVVDLDTLRRAVEVRAAIATHQQAIIAQLAKPKAWAYGLHKWFCSLEAAALAPFNALDGYERQQITAFKDAEDRARREREKALAEQRRRDDEQRAADEAAALESAGEPALAAAVVAEAIAAPAPVVVLPDTTKTVPGLRFRRVWKWRLVRIELVPREFLIVDESKLAKYATAMRESARVPGIEFYSDDVPVR